MAGMGVRFKEQERLVGFGSATIVVVILGRSA